MSVYLHLFHGRNSPDQDMDDWGFDGPTIGPLGYVHITYMSDIKISMPFEVAEIFFPEVAADHAEIAARNYRSPDAYPVEHHLPVVGDVVEHQGRFYGDFSVFTK